MKGRRSASAPRFLFPQDQHQVFLGVVELAADVEAVGEVMTAGNGQFGHRGDVGLLLAESCHPTFGVRSVRAQLANECADTGLIALYDSDAEVHRRLHCFDIGSGEPAADSETTAEADGFRA